MNSMSLKSLLIAVVVIAAFAAGTVLLGGYVDKPSQGTAVAADSKCADCPREGTPECCKVAGSCQEHKGETAATAAETSTCGLTCGGQEEVKTHSCSGSGCGSGSSCGSGSGCGSGCAGKAQTPCAGGCADQK